MRTRLLALVLGIAACGRGGANARSTNSAAGDVASDPPTRVVRLSSISGTVSRQVPGSDVWARPVPNLTLTSGDKLFADATARAELDFGTGAIRLGHGGALTVTNVTDSFTQFGLNEGALEASLFRYDKDDSLELDTPNGALVPTEPGTYIVSIEPTGGGTVVSVESGRLQLAGPGLHESLNPGEVVRLVGTGPIQTVSLDASYTEALPIFADFDRWRSARDPLFTSPRQSSRYVSAIPGREDLDDNGVWVTDAANVHVWCPASVDTTWVPYRAGHWSWVEPWGWTWVGDEPWAYAPFHYGRWEQTVASAQCKSGWAWVPGPVASQAVWSPALVAFVDGAALEMKRGPDVEAWFPLGPREPFFPWYHHSDGYLHDVNATNLIQVRDVDSLIHDDDICDIRRVNRENALTIIPSAVFSAGEAVEPRALGSRPDLLPPVRIAAHPSVNPQPELLAGGDPVPTPQAQLDRAEAVVARARTDAPARLSSTARQAAMQAHPGRPLEPRQIDNVRAGRPAGPARDREIPGHRLGAPELED